jgi:hypothetical protein
MDLKINRNSVSCPMDFYSLWFPSLREFIQNKSRQERMLSKRITGKVAFSIARG